MINHCASNCGGKHKTLGKFIKIVYRVTLGKFIKIVFHWIYRDDVERFLVKDFLGFVCPV